MKLLSNIKLLTVLVLFIIALPAAQAKQLKVLTIGNSFADSAFVYLPSIVKAVPDCDLLMKRANIGGCSLERHWKEVEKSEKNPEYKPYRKKNNLKEMLEMEKWDIVTMQQLSNKSFKVETYEPYFENLYNYVRKYAPQAEIVIQQTWSYRADHYAFSHWGISDQVDMYNKLSNAYRTIAEKYQCRVLPTGMALHIARQDQPEKIVVPEKVDMKSFTHPDKPVEPANGFTVGYYWKKNKKDGTYKLGRDLKHLNNRGRYLQACVWFAKFFDKPTSEITFIPPKLTKEDAEFLQTSAQKAVDQYKDYNVKEEATK